MVREAVSDGADVVALMTAVLKGDRKALGVRTVSLKDRMQAAEWLAERGFGKTIPVVDLPEERPQVSFEDQLQAWMEQLPPALREPLARELDAQFYAAIDAEVAKAEAAVRANLPGPPIDIRDFVVAHRADCLTIPGVRDVTLSDSYDIILEVDAEVPDDRLMWIEREACKRLRHPVVTKRRSR